MPFIRRLLLLAAGFAVPLAGLASAQDPGQPQPSGRGRGGGDGQFVPPGGPALAIREALDKDKDGKLSADELKMAAESLATIDANKDGKLDAGEIGWPPQFGRGRGGRGGRGGGGRGGFGGRGGGPPVDFSKRILNRDSNNDGKVTADELPRSMRRVVELADQDKDAAIDAAEAEKFAKQYGAVGRAAGPNRPGEPAAQPRLE
jgi:EF hand